RARLSQETVASVFCIEVGVQELQRHRRLEQTIVGEPDAAHAAFAEQALQLVLLRHDLARFVVARALVPAGRRWSHPGLLLNTVISMETGRNQFTPPIHAG